MLEMQIRDEGPAFNPPLPLAFSRARTHTHIQSKSPSPSLSHTLSLPLYFLSPLYPCSPTQSLFPVSHFEVDTVES